MAISSLPQRDQQDGEIATVTTDIWSEWLLSRRHGDNPEFEPVIRPFLEQFRNRVLDGADLRESMTLVDVGTGDGLIAFGAIERIGPSLKAVLVDVSAPLLAHAETVALNRGVRSQCTFVHTSAESLDGVPSGSADALTTRAVLAYVKNKAAAANQFFRVLKPGGRISIVEPINQDDAIRLAALTNILKTVPVNDETVLPHLLQRCRALQLPSTIEEIKSNPLTNFTERDLIRHFEDAGFRDIRLEFHVSIAKQPATPWETFIHIGPRPGALTLHEIFTNHFTTEEAGIVENSLRPLVESGNHVGRDAVAYLTAEKPGEQS